MDFAVLRTHASRIASEPVEFVARDKNPIKALCHVIVPEMVH
jgi:hypothetical protein